MTLTRGREEAGRPCYLLAVRQTAKGPSAWQASEEVISEIQFVGVTLRQM